MTNEENILFQRDLEARRCVQYDRETGLKVIARHTNHRILT